jgi:hypothetical protein
VSPRALPVRQAPPRQAARPSDCWHVSPRRHRWTRTPPARCASTAGRVTSTSDLLGGTTSYLVDNSAFARADQPAVAPLWIQRTGARPPLLVRAVRARGALLESEPRGDDTRRSTTSVGGSPPRALRVGVGRVPLRALRRDINARLGQFSEEEAVPVHEDVVATLDRAMAAAGKPALKPMGGSPAPSSGRGASGSRARHSMWSSW